MRFDGIAGLCIYCSRRSFWGWSMQRVIVSGGERLAGEVQIGGSKNAALPLLFGGIVTGEVMLSRKGCREDCGTPYLYALIAQRQRQTAQTRLSVGSNPS